MSSVKQFNRGEYMVFDDNSFPIITVRFSVVTQEKLEDWEMQDLVERFADSACGYINTDCYYAKKVNGP